MDERPYFTGSAEMRPEPTLPAPLEPRLRSNGHYVPGLGLRRAVDVALILGQPLLLTGEPGTGKSTLAAAVAHELFNDRFLKMQVKSGSGREDLLYRIDEIARFRDAQPNRTQRPLIAYTEFRPLGEAIIRACDPNLPLRDRAGRPLRGDESFLDDAFGPDRKNAIPTARDLLPDVGDWESPQRWVVLVDELDKASRDMPNDLLEEFESMAFAIPEMEISISPGDGAPRPVVVVTSNSERSLPEAFLRRCAFYQIPFPTTDELIGIISSRLVGLRMDGDRVRDLLRLFRGFRDAMQRKPGTAELLQWLYLADNDPKIATGASREQMIQPLTDLIASVAKQDTDFQEAVNAIKSWAAEK